MSKRFLPDTAPLIGLAGYAQNGKDTAGAILVEEFGFKRFAFADILKAIAYDINPMVSLQEDLASLVDRVGWDRAKQSEEVRRFLQHLGMAVRVHLGPETWVDATMNQVLDYMRATNCPVVITDVRFPNEVDAIWTAAGEVVRVSRPGFGPVNAHESETALDGHTFKTVLHNDGNLGNFQNEVRAWAHQLTDSLVLHLPVS